MSKSVKILAMLGMVAGTGAYAQQSAFSGQDGASKQVEAFDDSLDKAAERDLPTFGNTGRELGWTGSVSASANATSGNTDSVDVGAGARLGYYDGVNGHRLNFAMSYSENNDVRTKNESFLSYDYTREFGSNLYGYGQLQGAYSEFGAYEEDLFGGLGIGYRAVNSADTNWSIQTGPGFRKAKTAKGSTIEEFAWSLGSFFSTKLSDTASLYNDTNVLWSDADVFTTNELGVNVAMTNTLALRTALTTKHHTQPAAGFEETDNALGVSLVYAFN